VENFRTSYVLVVARFFENSMVFAVFKKSRNLPWVSLRGYINKSTDSHPTATPKEYCREYVSLAGEF